jgi:hypothetical protein
MVAIPAREVMAWQEERVSLHGVLFAEAARFGTVAVAHISPTESKRPSATALERSDA